MKARKTILRHPTRWTVVIGARIQRFDSEHKADDALAKGVGPGESGYVLPPTSADDQ